MKISHISSFITATDAERKQRARCCFKVTGAAVKKIDNMYKKLAFSEKRIIIIVDVFNSS